MCVPGHGDVRRRDLRVQVDAGGGFAGGGDQVKPADLVRRVRAQHELGRCMPAAEPELVAGTAVICGGKRAERPAGHGEPRAVRRLQVSDQEQLAADVVVPDRDHLADRHYPPRCPVRRRPGVSRAEAGDGERHGAGPARRAVHQPGQPLPRVRWQPALTRAGLVFLAGLADGDGKLEVGPDLIGSAGVDSAHGGPAPVPPVRAWRYSAGPECGPRATSSRAAVRPLPAAAGRFPRARGSCPQCPPGSTQQLPGRWPSTPDDSGIPPGSPGA